jgi:hypothetical protein
MVGFDPDPAPGPLPLPFLRRASRAMHTANKHAENKQTKTKNTLGTKCYFVDDFLDFPFDLPFLLRDLSPFPLFFFLPLFEPAFISLCTSASCAAAAPDLGSISIHFLQSSMARSKS